MFLKALEGFSNLGQQENAHELLSAMINKILLDGNDPDMLPK